MGLDSKYFSYCKEVGLLKENWSKQSALDYLIAQVKTKKACDPAYIAKLEKLTLNSSNVCTRVAVLYHYDANLTYSQRGSIKHGEVAGFASSKGSVREGLKIDQFKDGGDYTVIKDVSTITYPIYNDKNQFTYEEIKGAMKGLLNSKVPAGTTSYETNGWSVSAFLVPILCVEMEHNGKTQWLLYNLHNGYASWDWVHDPALIAKGMKAKKTGGLIKLASFVLPILGFLIAGMGGGTNSALAFLFPIATIILNIVIAKKTSKSKEYFKRFFIDKPNAGLTAAMKAPIGMAVVGFIGMLLTIIAK